MQKYIATDLLEYTKFTYEDNIETTWLKLLASLRDQIDRAIEDIETSNQLTNALFSIFVTLSLIISNYTTIYP